MPKRIQRKRTKGWRMPENAVYVGRPTRWGNPFRVVPDIEGAAPIDAVRRFEEMLKLGDSPKAKDIFSSIYELRGKDLACWCPAGQPCHADVLLEIANNGEIGKCYNGAWR